MSGRARFRFRDDPKLRALFGAYSADRPGARKRAPADEPKPGDEKPTARQPIGRRAIDGGMDPFDPSARA